VWNRSKKKKFFDENIVIKNDVSNFCETNHSSSSSLNKFCIKAVEIEKEEKERKNRFCFEFFEIDFALNCVHVNEIENLRNVVSVIEKIRKYQKISFKEKRKKKMFFETFNQYRENRSISNENDINLAKKKLSKSSSHQKKNNICFEWTRADQIFDDDDVFTSFADVASLINHHVLVWDFWNVSFRWIQYHEIFWSICWFVSELRSRKRNKNSSFVSLLRFYKRAVCASRD
jgi:hypothetical protein